MRQKMHFLLKLNVPIHSSLYHCVFFFIGVINHFCIYVQMGNSEGREIKLCGNEWIFDSYLIISFYFYVIYNAAVVVRRIMDPIGIIDGKITIMFAWIKRTQNLNGQHI